MREAILVVEQEGLLGNIPSVKKLDTFSREELIDRVTFLEEECLRAVKQIYLLRNQELTDSQIRLLLEEQLSEARRVLYEASSERYKKPVKPEEGKVGPPAVRRKRPSERYPNVPVREEVVRMDPAPSCTSCGKQMIDSGMTEDSEKLAVIPKRFEIVLTKRAKYRCTCQSCIVTAPVPLRIAPGSSYSDEMIVDIALSKYCDLIPVNRYVAMAARLGVKGLPAHSLIETTHVLAEFLSPVYQLLRRGILESKVLHADETPHKMLEGSKTQSWYLWGFSTTEFSYFECRDTRSGDVAGDILKNSRCEFLVSDVYTGYGKATRVANEQRVRSGLSLIRNAYCNAHARRYFFKAWQSKYKEASFYLDAYHEIYQLGDKVKEKPPPEGLELRREMRPHFESMRSRAEMQLSQYPEKNQYGKALRYFLENFEGLTLFLDYPDIPMDNNPQERLHRNHVVGRKTWYGTHSKLGAKTASILFSLVESCRLNGVNPREYFPKLCADMLAGKDPYTPRDFKTLH